MKAASDLESPVSHLESRLVPFIFLYSFNIIYLWALHITKAQRRHEHFIFSRQITNYILCDNLMNTVGKEQFLMISISIFLNVHQCFVFGNLQHISPCFEMYTNLPAIVTLSCYKTLEQILPVALNLVPTTQHPTETTYRKVLFCSYFFSEISVYHGGESVGKQPDS